uniref:Phorbol-ester/DAG-type domain-containing protein n=1 Tax=Angiostrongylus cantonensis TaxID=6313 RepID=A0A158PBH0_ANGCA
MSRKLIPIDASKECEPRTVAAHILARHPLKELQSKSTVDNNDIYDSKRASSLVGTNLCKATMRHDIPHRWTELRHFGLFSIKCAVCFVGVPTFAKKKRCTHCGIIVHSQCASRVVNTCGLPDQCANYYLDSYSAPCGKMNGWIRLCIYSDDFTVREWLSVWGEMDEKRLLFYDKDPTNFDLRTPFLSVDLEKDLRIVRVGSEVPVKAENGQASHNIVHIRTEKILFSVGIFTFCDGQRHFRMPPPPINHVSYPTISLFILFVNNLKVIDSYILIGAQSGLFFTYMSSPRLPVRIGGFNSVSYSSLDLPELSSDVIPGYDNLHVLTHHQQEGQWYLLAANCTKINVLKYNAARDVFIAQQVIKINEPAVCIQSTPRGIYFGSDSFYFVQLGQGELDPVRLADPSIVDYPIALLLIRDDEVLLAYQNYGIFVNSRGERTRSRTVEWEQMPMEFVYTAPYLYVVHYDSIEILRIADYNGLDSDIILDEREVYACHNAHVVYSCSNGDVFISISNTDSVELHRFNATNSKRNPTKRKGLASAGLDKRSKIAV